MSELYTNILVELNKAVKALNFYPKGHPTLAKQLSQCVNLVKGAFSDGGDLKWSVDQKGFYDAGGKPIAGTNPAIQALAKQLFLRKVKIVTFNAEISPADIRGLLYLITMDGHEVRAKGGPEKILVIKGVRGILLNEMKFNELKELEEELKDEIEQGDEEEAPEDKNEDEGEAAEEVEEPDEELADPESIEALLPRLKEEKDPMVYQDISVRLNEQTAAASREEHSSVVLKVMGAYLEHRSPKSGLDEKIREKAAASLDELLLTDTINMLIMKVGTAEKGEREVVDKLLMLAGDEAENLLLDSLVDAKDVQARRNIFTTIVRFGDRIRAKVIDRLSDERWFAVRQMVSLLGEIGGADSVEGLGNAYRHQDVRVKKEVLKSLARIPSPKSRKLLLEALGDDDKTIQGQAIISLGILKDVAAIYALGEIANMRDAFAENVEQRKEAVKALGMIGTDKAVPYLKKVLTKKGWFGKSGIEDLRSTAAVALGKIGGEEAMGALEKTCKGSTGSLYNTCKRILEGSKQ